MKIGLLSDLHSNAPATRQALSKLSIEGVGRFLCAGDIVGYYPFPNETVDLIHSYDVDSVVGNHDVAVLTGETDNFSINATRAVDWTRRNISEESLDLLDQYPKVLNINIAGVEILVVHGSPHHPLREYIYPEDITQRKIEEWFDLPPDLVVLGHTHIPFESEVKGIQIVNPGSVGQPRDEDQRASFAILETETLDIKFERASYEIEETARKTKEYLPIQLAERLYSGN